MHPAVVGCCDAKSSGGGCGGRLWWAAAAGRLRWAAVVRLGPECPPDPPNSNPHFALKCQNQPRAPNARPPNLRPLLERPLQISLSSRSHGAKIDGAMQGARNANECISEHLEASALQSESRFDLKRLSEKLDFCTPPGRRAMHWRGTVQAGYFLMILSTR